MISQLAMYETHQRRSLAAEDLFLDATDIFIASGMPRRQAERAAMVRARVDLGE